VAMNDCARLWRIEVATDIESPASILEQASHWWELLHSESASSSDHREFGEWVARSPERVEAYLETARLVKAIKSPRLIWPSTSAEVLIREAKSSSETVLPFSPAQAAASADRRGARQSPGRLAWAAAAVLLIGVGLVLFTLGAPQKFRTALGEQRSVLLADGSRVTLNTASTIEVISQRGRREVRLVQGEALFEVAHEATRPFVVRAGNALLRDVGTQFNVDMRSNGTAVTVVEGQVAVDSTAASGSAAAQAGYGAADTAEPLILRANDRVVVSPAGVGAPQHGVNAAASVAWTQRRLVFERRPLSEVAEEFNRYNKERIDIDSAELKRQEVTGVFEAKDPASFVAFLSGIPGVEIQKGPKGIHVVLSRSRIGHPDTRGVPQ
jgi:transmembrane sensor